VNTTLRWLLAPVLLGLAAASAPAGWVAVKNDTGHTILIKEAAEGLFRRGKVVRLLPGEVYREYQAKPGYKGVEVFDAKCVTKAVHAGKLTWQTADVTWTVTVAADPRTKADQWALTNPAVKAAVAKAVEPPKPDEVIKVEAPAPPPVPKR